MTITLTAHAARTENLRASFRRSYHWPAALPVLTAALAVTAYSDNALLPIEAGYGANPRLRAPPDASMPTVHIADAHGWPAERTPQVASLLSVKCARGH